MSFFRKLFGGSSDAAPKAQKTLEYKGYTIKATPYKEAGQYQTCGVVSKSGEKGQREHRFIRADRFADEDAAAEHAIVKGRQLVDQLGEAMFKQDDRGNN